MPLSVGLPLANPKGITIAESRWAGECSCFACCLPDAQTQACVRRNFGYSTSDRDGRSVMLLDTRDPKHGRSSLRVTVPTATPLLFPFSTSFADAGQGPRIKPAAQYNISFWAS